MSVKNVERRNGMKDKKCGSVYATNSMSNVKAPKPVAGSGEPKSKSYKTTGDMRSKKTGK